MNELALFAGAGGGILGGHLLGWRCVCAVECEPYAAGVLLARQNDGILPPFPVWDDVRTFDGRPWRGIVDVVSGGFPCQDISAAGKGAGIDGERSGLWKEMGRIIGEVGPRFVLVENSPVLTSRGLGVVLGDLAALGYDARWGVLGAVDAGAPHKRERIWIVAYAKSIGERSRQRSRRDDGGRQQLEGARSRGYADDGGEAADVADADGERGEAGVSEPEQWEERHAGIANDGHSERAGPGIWWSAEPDVGRVAHGVAARVDRLAALGNGQVPAVAVLAWRVLHGDGGKDEGSKMKDERAVG